MDRWMNTQTDEQMYGKMNRWAFTVRQTDSWTDEQRETFNFFMTTLKT